VNDEVPPTVKAPLWVRLPANVCAVSVPTDEAPRVSAVELTILGSNG
jgi:hypothetical protein